MILVLWLARLCWFVSALLKRAGDALYSVCWRLECRRLKREAHERAAASARRDYAAIDDLIAETRPVRRVGSPIHRER